MFARVIAANKDVEPELACVNKKGKANGLQVRRYSLSLLVHSFSL